MVSVLGWSVLGWLGRYWVGLASEVVRAGSEPTGHSWRFCGKAAWRVALLGEFAKLRSQLAAAILPLASRLGVKKTNPVFTKSEATRWWGWPS